MPIHDDDFQQALARAGRAGAPAFEPEQQRLLARGLRALQQAGVPHLVAGALAVHAYTDIWRDTKDLDLCLKPADVRRALRALAEAGFEVEVEFGHWLAKARQRSHVIDLIFGMGNGRLHVDDSWFAGQRVTEIAGVQTPLLPIEELLVMKAYVAERYRFDGADVAHLIEAACGRLDWSRVLARLGEDSELLLWQLILFDFVYPGHAEYLPQALMARLFAGMQARWAAEPRPDRACRGTLLDPFSFLVDIKDRGYEDRRDLAPLVNERAVGG